MSLLGLLLDEKDADLMQVVFLISNFLNVMCGWMDWDWVFGLTFFFFLFVYLGLLEIR